METIYDSITWKSFQTALRNCMYEKECTVRVLRAILLQRQQISIDQSLEKHTMGLPFSVHTVHSSPSLVTVFLWVTLISVTESKTKTITTNVLSQWQTAKFSVATAVKGGGEPSPQCFELTHIHTQHTCVLTYMHFCCYFNLLNWGWLARYQWSINIITNSEVLRLNELVFPNHSKDFLRDSGF